MDSTDELLALHPLSQALNLPASWLRAEAEAGRIPSLRAGRRRLYSLVAVRETLLRRAARIEGDPRRRGAQ